jgi:Arm DNA-binding domain
MGWRDGCKRRTTVKTKTISAALQAANASVGVHKVAGVAGLYLKIGETGAGSFFHRYRLGDRQREIGLGSRDKVSLADACKAAKAWAVLRDEGHDPIETRRRERADNLAKSRAQQPITFKQMAETYLQAHGASWKHRYARAGWWDPLAKFAFPIIGGLSLDEIEISHITAIMLRAEKAGARHRQTGPIAHRAGAQRRDRSRAAHSDVDQSGRRQTDCSGAPVEKEGRTA